MFNNVITKNNTRLPNRVIKSADERALYQKYYGVRWNQSAGADTYERTGLTKGLGTSQTVDDSYLPIQAQMKRSVINDAGVVQYYLDPEDSTKKADGSAANLDGTDGQVMVEIPIFYYRFSAASSVYGWDISEYNVPGFTVHPMFLTAPGVVADKIYVAAYEASLYDDSAGSIVGGDSSIIDTANDKLASVS